MDDEIMKPLSKQDSCPSPRLDSVCSFHSDESFDDDNYSWEGAVQKWEGDGASKRLELLSWMEQRLQEVAEKERREAEELHRA
jgi:hypothetical protein